MTSHAIALEVARIIRDSLYVVDGSLRPCAGSFGLNPKWVEARANNIATALCATYDMQPHEAQACTCPTPAGTPHLAGCPAYRSPTTEEG